MMPYMEQPLTPEELAEAQAQLGREGEIFKTDDLTPFVIRERALRNRLEDLLNDGLEASFIGITEAAAKVGCFDEVVRLLGIAIDSATAKVGDEELKLAFATLRKTLDDPNPLRPYEIAAEPPAMWIGHTTRTTAREGSSWWCFAFNPPEGFDWFEPEALVVWPPMPSISIDTIRIGRYDVESWKSVRAAEVPFGSTLALACRFNPISLGGIPLFGTTAAGRQMEVQLSIEDARDVDRIAVLVRGRPVEPEAPREKRGSLGGRR